MYYRLKLYVRNEYVEYIQPMLMGLVSVYDGISLEIGNNTSIEICYVLQFTEKNIFNDFKHITHRWTDVVDIVEIKDESCDNKNEMD